MSLYKFYLKFGKNILVELAKAINIEIPIGRVQKIASVLAKNSSIETLGKLTEISDKYAIVNFANLSTKQLITYLNKGLLSEDLIVRAYTSFTNKSPTDIDISKMVRSIGSRHYIEKRKEFQRIIIDEFYPEINAQTRQEKFTSLQNENEDGKVDLKFNSHVKFTFSKLSRNKTYKFDLNNGDRQFLVDNMRNYIWKKILPRVNFTDRLKISYRLLNDAKCITLGGRKEK